MANGLRGASAKRLNDAALLTTPALLLAGRMVLAGFED
jgi:hypothetical protein